MGTLCDVSGSFVYSCVAEMLRNMLGISRKLGSMVRKWVISPTYKWEKHWGEIIHFLTIDPKFQQDIQVFLITLLVMYMTLWKLNSSPLKFMMLGRFDPFLFGSWRIFRGRCETVIYIYIYIFVIIYIWVVP